MVEFVSQPFNKTQAMKGLVRVITPIVDEYMARLSYKDTNGDWQQSTDAAIYLGYLEETSPSHPRIHITSNGNTNTTPTDWENGLIEVEDPDDPPNMITIPFKRSYIDYMLTLTCDSGGIDKVNRGEVMDSDFILSRIRDSLNFESVKTSIHTDMNSSVEKIAEVTPIYDLMETSFHDSSVMRLKFSTTNTVFNYEGGYFDTIEYDGTLYRYSGDPDPLTSSRTVTSLP